MQFPVYSIYMQCFDRWEQRGVTTQDIIPFRILPGEFREISLAAPFASGEYVDRLRMSAIALSFKIHRTEHRLVVTISWPRKLGMLDFTSKEEFNSYLVSVIPESTRHESLQISLTKLMSAVVNIKEPSSVVHSNHLQRYMYWRFPIVNPHSQRVDKFIHVLTNMGNARKNGMTVKVCFHKTLPDFAHGSARIVK